MSYHEVRESLNLLVDITSNEVVTADALCRESLREITAGLKADADTEDARVTAAAAGLAFYKLMLKRNSDSVDTEITSFKAGDVSISQGSNAVSNQLSRAEEYFKQCFAKIVPMCQDNGFAFTNVKVEVVV